MERSVATAPCHVIKEGIEAVAVAPLALVDCLGSASLRALLSTPIFLSPIFLRLKGGTHQVPFAADFLPTAVEEAPESHTHLNLPKRGLRRTFPPTIQFPMSRLVHNPLELAFGQVTLAYADHLTTISGFVMATRAGHRLRALIRSRPVGGMLVSKYENVVVGASKPVLVPIVAEAVQFRVVLARLAFSRGGTHRRHASLLARLRRVEGVFVPVSRISHELPRPCCWSSCSSVAFAVSSNSSISAFSFPSFSSMRP